MLPLESRVSEDGLQFLLTPLGAACRLPLEGTPALPRAPGPGEQYRFHFDMTRCIGCRCCEVACQEQNNNPAGIQWRRVGEIEGGFYPHTQRLYLSMGCNQCLEPACLQGCPVDAYSKDSLTGIVRHSAEICIGCQYCIWNCPYGVPQFNPERGVVGKCDLCYGRLEHRQLPACSAACPQDAIRVEVVNIAQWARERAEADSPGMPSAGHTVSTTRITRPAGLPGELRKADYDRVRPEDPHLPLVVMLVLTQLSAGAFAALWLAGDASPVARFSSLAVGLLSFGSSTLHLGRPAFAYRALKMWRRSWLSREVLFLSLFAALASAYSLSGSYWMGALTALASVAGITASARIYLVPARPAWDTPHTPVEFFSTAALLGSLFAAAMGSPSPAMRFAAAAAAVAQLLNQCLKLLRLARSEEFEMRASARLLASSLERPLILRLTLLAAGGIAAPLAGWPLPGLLLALAGELLGRYLFFVSVVPRNMAASFFGSRPGSNREAA